MIQIYTGKGKGKTTAALGLAVRAAGAGLKVFIAQFCKGRDSSELRILNDIQNITVKQFGRVCFISRHNPSCQDRNAAIQGLRMLSKIIAAGGYDVVILDEITIALKFKLLKRKEVAEFFANTPKHVELILTGRYAPAWILKKAELVS